MGLDYDCGGEGYGDGWYRTSGFEPTLYLSAVGDGRWKVEHGYGDPAADNVGADGLCCLYDTGYHAEGGFDEAALIIRKDISPKILQLRG